MHRFKFSAGKVSAWILLTSLLFAAFLLGKTLTNVFATSITHKAWVAGGWGTCTSTGPQCGTDNGTQTRTLTCTYSDSGNDNCSLGTPVYTCDNLTESIHGTTYNVSEFYNKNTGDDNHCHRIVWDSLGSTKQTDFENMHHNDYNYSSPNHGNWSSAYNNHIDENPNASIDHYNNPDTQTQTQSCHTGVTQYNSCTPAGTCPTECGYQGGTVPDGRGGQTQCPATDSCEVDQCINLPGFQESVPANMSTNNDHTCSCNQGFHQVQQEVGFTCEPDPSTSPVPTPIPTPLSCSGDTHPDAAGKNCVKFELGGAPQGGNSGGQVLGASTGPQVLGASTMASTGTFDQNLYLAIMTLGGTLSAFGIKNFKKARQTA